MIDIIIPTYNSNRTLIETLYSIMNQTISDKFTVYIVDDCSNEDYTDIYNLFSKYLDLKLLKLDTNSGPGVARQYGIDHSTNDYIVFIDSDDTFYRNDSVEKLYNAIQGYDMAFGQMYYETYNSYTYHEGCLHGKMYKRSFLKDNEIKFNNLRSHEDNAFNQVCISIANVHYIEDVIYTYKYNDKSITNNEDKIKSLETYIDSMTWAFQKIDTFNNLNTYNVSVFVLSIILYSYFNYLTNPDEYNFVFDKLSFIKKMYYKYINYLPQEEYIRIYNDFHYNVVPNMTIEKFLNKIKE